MQYNPAPQFVQRRRIAAAAAFTLVVAIGSACTNVLLPIPSGDFGQPDTECAFIIPAPEFDTDGAFDRWVADNGGSVDYVGQDNAVGVGTWFDADGFPIGTSDFEDGDICAF
jgi:hypothetical protein